MDKVTFQMLKIYKPFSGLDWMNYVLVKKDVTFHHCKKRCDGGERTIENGALLMPHAHQYLHLIECKDIETYITINKILKMINQQGHEPNAEQRELVEYILRNFEKEHRNDKGSKGKSLIKYKYLQRGL